MLSGLPNTYYICKTNEKVSDCHIRFAVYRIVFRYHADDSHCMGKLVEVGIWQDETCNTCGAKHAHKPCCSTETQFIKISDDQNVDQLQVIKYVPMAIALLFDLRDLYNLPETEQEANIPVHSNTPPEWSGTDRLIHHCTFLI